MRLSTRTIAFAGMFTAIAFVLRLLSFTTLEYRFTFDDIAIMASGIFFGPWVGLLVGFSADFLYSLYMGFPLGIFTLASMSWGLIAGLLLYKNTSSIGRFPLVLLSQALSLLGFLPWRCFNCSIRASLPDCPLA
jgi:Putative regulator of cell autolysis